MSTFGAQGSPDFSSAENTASWALWMDVNAPSASKAERDRLKEVAATSASTLTRPLARMIKVLLRFKAEETQRQRANTWSRIRGVELLVLPNGKTGCARRS